MFGRKKRGDRFNEALKHYQNLRYTVEPAAYRGELVKIIELCQLAIQKQRGNGDAYVLLANATCWRRRG